jgi:hypothetical protein
MAVRAGSFSLSPSRAGHSRAASTLKTYSHLASAKRIPSDYELVTSGLLYYPGRGFEVSVPLGGFYAEHQAGSRLRLPEPERFADPRETTYARYVERAAESETRVDGVLASIEERRYDEKLAPRWKQKLADILGALRFPLHGLQMISAYVGQMAPGGRVTVSALCQCADEVRRIHRIAYRLTQLVLPSDPAAHGKDLWQKDPAWQPLREAIERALCAFDWGEALVVLDVCVKPMIDEIFMHHLPAVAQGEGDYLLGELFWPLAADCAWHQDWALGLLGTALEQAPENREAVSDWMAAWQPRVREAARALDALLPGAADAAERCRIAVESRFSTITPKATAP